VSSDAHDHLVAGARLNELRDQGVTVIVCGCLRRCPAANAGRLAITLGIPIEAGGSQKRAPSGKGLRQTRLVW
jgi:hypothetical protein